jgi:hypothetical protein
MPWVEPPSMESDNRMSGLLFPSSRFISSRTESRSRCMLAVPGENMGREEDSNMDEAECKGVCEDGFEAKPDCKPEFADKEELPLLGLLTPAEETEGMVELLLRIATYSEGWYLQRSPADVAVVPVYL